jgi:quinol-cytochrome oxidoreductase complex cytochrome b subunit
MTEGEVPKEEKTIPFYPDHVRTEAIVALGFIALAVLIGVIALRYPVGLGQPADPLNTPAHIKPEWYFLFLFQVLKYVPKTVGATLPFILLFVLAIWPFLDRGADSQRAKRTRIIATAIGLLIILILTLLGELT